MVTIIFFITIFAVCYYPTTVNGIKRSGTIQEREFERVAQHGHRPLSCCNVSDKRFLKIDKSDFQG
jgi:hypothetical protein